MARIRSVHPGIYTDEAWASVSLGARWLGVALCTEADDNGIFEWKPLQLKMRVFPADTVDVAALLEELKAAGIILPFKADGKAFGALKNFCKYQRPRKPKAWFPITPEARSFAAVGEAGADDDTPEPDPVPQKSEPPPVEPPVVPQKSEKSPQMEDGGWRGEEDANASFVVGKPNDDVRTAFDLWNELAERLGLPKAVNLNRARRGAIKARLAEGGLDAWRAALLAVERSSHCRGDNDRGWRADLDFVCQPKSFNRLLEGSYGSDAKTTHSASVIVLRPQVPEGLSLEELRDLAHQQARDLANS